MGEALFIRRHRSIELTRCGASLFETANGAFSDMRKKWQLLSGAPATLKISTGIHFMANWLSFRLASLQAVVGDVTIEHDTTFEYLDFVSGEIDVAIRNGDQRDSGLFSETICEEWWAPMGSPALAERLEKPEDLLSIPFIEARHPREPKGHPSIGDWLKANGVNAMPNHVQQVPHTETAMQMAADGLGVKLCQNVLAHSWIKDKRLVIPFKTAIRRSGIRFYLVCRSGEENSEPIASVRKFFRGEMAAMLKSPDLNIAEIFELPAIASRLDLSEGDA